MRNPIAVPALSVRALKTTVLSRHRSLPHLERKAYHLMMGLFCLGLYAFVLTRAQALVVLAVVGGIWVSLDLMRLYFPKMNELTLKWFGKIMRREELKSVSGNSFYILGLMTVLIFFPKPIVLLSVLFLAIGDPTAAVIGSLYGRHKLIGKKSVEGALANFLVSAVAVFLLGFFYLHLPVQQVVLLAWVGAFISTVAELAPLPIDDNFTIPVVSGVLLSIAAMFLPLF